MSQRMSQTDDPSEPSNTYCKGNYLNETSNLPIFMQKLALERLRYY